MFNRFFLFLLVISSPLASDEDPVDLYEQSMAEVELQIRRCEDPEQLELLLKIDKIGKEQYPRFIKANSKI